MVLPSVEQIKGFLSGIDRSFLVMNILLFASFIVPMAILYAIDADSFNYIWKGRAPYLLFLWLLFLEAYLGWKNLKKEPTSFWNKRTLLATFSLILPTVYAVAMSLGLKSGIIGVGTTLGLPVQGTDEWFLTHSWLFSFEYILFTAFFLTSIWLLYGVKGLKSFAVSSFFLGGIGIFYMIDTFYPYGTFTVLQSFVPVTVSGATSVLNFMGYGTQIFPGGTDGLRLNVTGVDTSYSAVVSWSCAGSHSLFLYSFMIMLFLRGTSISRIRKIIYVVVGAAGTFFVNILRIVAILSAGVNGGPSLATTFHEFYGEFFFIAWMFIYLSIIFISETRLIGKINRLRRSNPPLPETIQPTVP
jgi:thaumarchaeosortase